MSGKLGPVQAINRRVHLDRYHLLAIVLVMVIGSAVYLADSLTGLYVLAVVLCLYALPTFVAYNRKVPNLGSIAVINVLLGWTLVGWVVAMAMAARSLPPPEPQPVAATTFDCPHCLEPVKVGARVCPHCQRDIQTADHNNLETMQP